MAYGLREHCDIGFGPTQHGRFCVYHRGRYLGFVELVDGVFVTRPAFKPPMYFRVPESRLRELIFDTKRLSW